MTTRTPKQEQRMAMYSAHHTLRDLWACSVEDVMSRQGLDAPHALMALEDLRSVGLAVKEGHTYLLANRLFGPPL